MLWDVEALESPVRPSLPVRVATFPLFMKTMRSGYWKMPYGTANN